jgi:hypothetical protein
MRPAAREWFRNDFDAIEAHKRIDYWFCRGYVIFSDRHTKSTHLRTSDESSPVAAAAERCSSPCSDGA